MYGDQTSTTILSGTQAGGSVSAAVQRPFRGGHYARHQLQAECVSSATGAPATPAAGTLTVKARVPGAGQFAAVASSRSRRRQRCSWRASSRRSRRYLPAWTRTRRGA